LKGSEAHSEAVFRRRGSQRVLETASSGRVEIKDLPLEAENRVDEPQRRVDKE
jgi:hypothetical protein